VVWSRTAVQLAAEEQRRRLAVERQAKGLLDLGEGPDPAGRDKPADGS
jgi:hypothetical protein